MYFSTLYRTSAALMPFLTRPCGALLPCTTQTTDDLAISPFCLLSLMVLGFSSNRTWVWTVLLSFSCSNSSLIFCRASVAFPMYCTRGTISIYSLCHVSFPSTSLTPLSTVLTGMMMMSRFRRANSAVAFW